MQATPLSAVAGTAPTLAQVAEAAAAVLAIQQGRACACEPGKPRPARPA